jgi:hypothetical protein
MEVVPPEPEMALGNETKPWCHWCMLVLQKVVQFVTRHILHFTDLQGIRKNAHEHIFILNTSQKANDAHTTYKINNCLFPLHHVPTFYKVIFMDSCLGNRPHRNFTFASLK